MLKNLTILLLAAAVVTAILAAFLWWTRPPQTSTNAGEAGEASCGPAWRIVNSADPSKEYNEFHSIAAVSPKDIWAVGTFGTEQYALTLTEHWDGARWAHVPSPSVPAYSNHLYAVAAISSNDAWAIGGSHRGTDFWQTLTLRWNGAQWNIVSSPNVAPITILNGIAAVGPNDAWAVGEFSRGRQGVGSQPVIMRWDGAKWSVAPGPGTAQRGALNAVVALSKDDVWAAGAYDDKSGTISKPLIMHWNGHAWALAESPGAGTIWALAAVSPKDIWAVGNNGPQTLAMHWDGKGWSAVASPNPTSGSNSLNGVAAIGANDVWAVGSQNVEGADRTLTVHWDGKQWVAAPSPSKAAYLDTLSSVAAANDRSIWAAGSYIADTTGTNKTLTLHYNNPCATP